MGNKNNKPVDRTCLRHSDKTLHAACMADEVIFRTV